MMLILYFRRKKRAEMHLIVMIAIHILQCFHYILCNWSERGQPDLVDEVPSLQPLLRSQLKLLVVEKTIVEALLDALVVQVLPDEHQLLASVAPRPRLIVDRCIS